MAGNLPPSRFTVIFLSPTSQLFVFSSPLLLAITSQFSAIPHEPQTPPLLRSRIQRSVIGETLHPHDFLPIWQVHTLVDAVALHLPAFIRCRESHLFRSNFHIAGLFPL